MYPVLDCTTLLTFLNHDRELLRELVGLFKKNLPSAMTEMRKAIDSGDSNTLARTAHSLKGSSSNLAARALSQAALNLEHMGRAGDMVRAQKAYSALEKEIQRLMPALEACCQETESDHKSP